MSKDNVICMLNIIKSAVNVMTEKQLVRIIDHFIKKIKEF